MVSIFNIAGQVVGLQGNQSFQNIDVFIAIFINILIKDLVDQIITKINTHLNFIE